MTDADHDLLVITANNTNWIKDWALNHEKEDAASAERVRLIAEAAHKRVDDAAEAVNTKVTEAARATNERIDKTNDSLNTRFYGMMVSGVLAIVVLAIGMFIKK